MTRLAYCENFKRPNVLYHNLITKSRKALEKSLMKISLNRQDNDKNKIRLIWYLTTIYRCDVIELGHFNPIV